MHVGAKLRRIVEARKGLTHRSFAASMGFTEPNLYRIYKKESMGTDIVQKACQILAISVSAFFNEEKEYSAIVEEPMPEYGNPALENKLLKARVKDLEELNELLRESRDIYKEKALVKQKS